ncbi:hypothetical protein KSF78_0002827 [Schistosoma japonicum]|nr:hypothetical protein KSF78_0002827 [Schistosoma japonicum]KAH8863901.1 hypothetical protein KSF78_0002827 [Schistosoma japonicum]KAH8863902.1 hypothetical protein KSF78_0002827 [Schistosoma japonicum]KAH8863903.1 hypothetical protein KSF78_0002827 [Schistosoma japonicum]
MSVFERLQHRLAKCSTSIKGQTTEQICQKPNSVSTEQTISLDCVATTVDDRSAVNTLSRCYDNSQTWSTESPNILSNITSSYSNPSLHTVETVNSKSSETDIHLPKSHFSRSHDQLNTPYNSSVNSNQRQQQPRRKRAKTPASSFYRVSSDDDSDTCDDDEDEDYVDNNNEEYLDQCDNLIIRQSTSFERRSQRLRRSIDRAKAALPADFADRIEISDSLCDLPNHEPSSNETQLQKHHHRSASNLGVDLTDHLSSRDSNSEENVNNGGNNVNGHCESQEILKSSENHTKLITKEKHSEIDEASKTTSADLIVCQDGENNNTSTTSPTTTTVTSTSPNDNFEKSDVSFNSNLQTGIYWHPGPPQPLSELMYEFRSGSPGKTYLIKAICKRSGCRCALRNYDGLMLYPVPDSTLASATWESWIAKDKNPRFPTSSCEVQSKLILFRQCRGWYEVLNENHQPTPHITTLEQIRRTRASTFIVRQDMRCLVAPPNLIIPSLNDVQEINDDTSPYSIPSSLISLACSTETLANSKPDIIRAGTLLQYVTYLPQCSVRRGKKIKELGLVLAIERSNCSKQSTIHSDLLPLKPLSRTIYLGIEDSTPAVFPPKLSLSVIAGPENISGVHLLSGLLRKFRLPLSIRPIPLPDSYYSTNNNSSVNRPTLMNPNPKVTCGLVAVHSLVFTEKHFLRLHSLYKGDILIIAPISSPERLFLITPSMLRDHSFQTGFTHDPTYALFMENHRIQACNFLAIAHAQETLNYLVRHMQDITREPRDSYTSRQQAKQKTTDLPPTPESYMTQDEIYKAYDEIDDIYFYIRHGYYPSKVRKPDDANSKTESTPSNNKLKVQKYSANSSYTSDDMPERIRVTQKDGGLPRPNMTIAEDLLAASLYTPHNSTLPLQQSSSSTKSPSDNSKIVNPNQNSINNMINATLATLTSTTYRAQPKEYGI